MLEESGRLLVKRIVLVFFILTIFLCSCGKSKNSIDSNPDGENFMQISEYIGEVFPSQEGEKLQKGIVASGDCIYSLDAYYDYEPVFQKTYYLYIYNTVSHKFETRVYKTNEAIINPFVISGRVFANIFRFGSDDDTDQFSVCELKEDGTVEIYSNVADVVKKHNLTPKQNYIIESVLRYEPDTGITYLLSEFGNAVYVIDSEGKEISAFTGFENTEAVITEFSETSDGKMLFNAVSNGRSTVFGFENGEPYVLYQGKPGDEYLASCVTRDCNDQFVILKSDSIVSWDMNTGVSETLFLYNGADIYEGNKLVLRNSNDEVVLYAQNTIRVITKAGPERKVDLTFQTIGIDDFELEEKIHNYESTHPGVHIEILPKIDESDMSRVFADISKGNGPDMLQISREQLEDLYKNEALLDMSQYVSNELKEELFGAVLANGTMDGKFLMYPTGMSLLSVVANRKYCNSDTMNYEDIIRVIEQRDKEGNPFQKIVCGYMGCEALNFFVQNICESEFVDLDKNEASFNSDSFIKLLEICKRYHNPEYEYLSEDECIELMKRDSVLFYVPGDNLGSFSNYNAALGNDYKAIGFPTNTEEGNKLSFFGGIVVNKNVENIDIIADFLNSIYSLELLAGDYIPMRKDFYKGRIVIGYDKWTTGVRLSENGWIPLTLKPDGTTYVDEYLELLQKAVPADNTIRAKIVKEIIYDEIGVFFEGDKSAEETAEIIQSRVKIYLEETK